MKNPKTSIHNYEEQNCCIDEEDGKDDYFGVKMTF